MEDYPQVNQAPKPKRLRQKDLEELRDKSQAGDDKLIPIWQKAGPNEPLTPFLGAFSRKALCIFSPRWEKQLDANPDHLVLDGQYLTVYKLILDWIKLCIEEGNDVKFPDIEELEIKTKEDPQEHERAHPLHVLLQVIGAANYLQIPEGSLQNGLMKRAPGYARKHVISLSFVERICSKEDIELTSDLREAAAISIFEAWWSHKLDEPEYDAYVLQLEQMRKDDEQLDKDLHEQFDKKKAFIEGKREERKRARDAEASASPVDSGLDTLDTPTDGGWDSVNISSDTGDSGDGWNQAAMMVTKEVGGGLDKSTEKAPSWAGASESM